ncbi:acetyl/propionyl/methylcrotonyl-CoA carboxylase subunit alpha [Maricaulis sp.]|uniref:acetyl/propionyl/methylcrotonyl-CoA carboxylase subunit alpha n=1 Tax=Maricaulis sp. TaxID=1486257 RepID=UPI003A8ECA50
MMTASAFRSILIANRGEIACRIIATARRLGYRTIAVHSPVDSCSPHVRLADDAVLLGPDVAAQSYLSIERLIEAARSSGAEAIHPGYGFLSENADFARACRDAGLIFIGPSPDAIAVMGDKAAAKRRMVAAGVPCLPGYQDSDQSDEAFLTASRAIGYPIMIKAVAGGGGRGMRRVESEPELIAALPLARSESEQAFGAGDLILERALDRPRHVEIQIFCDSQGHAIHLGERDCSVQRRHQKVLEESPCPVMTDDLRAEMGAAAILAAQSVDYVGAGTVEYMLDADGRFYFLEMNTRLQVEHPVTEMVTGLDLVELQLSVARGEPLGLTQNDITLTGHAIEARLYAEDPARGFLPCSGAIERWIAPSGDGIRVDAGIESGSEVSPHYDPMIAKIIARGPSRAIACQRLEAALQATGIAGLQTNRDFLIAAVREPAFQAGEAMTAFVGDMLPGGDFKPLALPGGVLAAACVLQLRQASRDALQTAVTLPAALLGWHSAGRLSSSYAYQIEGMNKPVTASAVSLGTDAYRVQLAGAFHLVEIISERPGHARLIIDGKRQLARFEHLDRARLFLMIGDHAVTLGNQIGAPQARDEAVASGRVTAPMHGLLVEVCIAPGDRVTKGDRIAILEAMKMQHEIRADLDGIIVEIGQAGGSQVKSGQRLFIIEPDTTKQDDAP